MKGDEINYVYVISAIEDGLPVAPCKIGITRGLNGRLLSLQTGNPKKLEIIASLPIPSRRVVEIAEQALHEVFDEFRLVGEWFDVNPIDATIGACTIIREIFLHIAGPTEGVYDALDNLGITKQITAAFAFAEHCKAVNLPLKSRLMK